MGQTINGGFSPCCRQGVDKQRGMIEWIECNQSPGTCHRRIPGLEAMSQ